MADKCTMSLLEAMDCLWFHQTVVVSVPNKTLQTAIPTSETLTCSSSSNTSQLSFPEEEISSAASFISTPSEDDCSNQLEIVENKEIKQNLKHPDAHPSSSRLNRSHKKKQRPRSYTGSITRLQKTMSSKTLEELELEEVKGFIDLGFDFSKDSLSPKMMSLVPGLQRIGSWDMDNDTKRDGTIQNHDHDLVEEEEEEEEQRGVMRPYLSEAWIENTPELGFTKMPVRSGAGDMKKRIRCWARTVASVVRQESWRSV